MKRVTALLSSIQPVSSQLEFCPADRLAQVLERWQRLGVGKGDLVLISMPNTVDQLVEFFAALLSKATPALLPPNFPVGRMERLCDTYSPRAIVSARNYNVGDASISQCENGAIVRVFPACGSRQYGEVLIFTSGTSGHLSACSFSFQKLLLNARLHAQSIGRTGPETLFLSLPVYYSFALVAQVLAAYEYGHRLIVGSSPFNLADFVRAVDKHHITGASLTPVLAKRVLASDKARDLRLKFLTIGGDKIESDDVLRLLRALPNTELFLTYGLTEAGPRVSTLAAHDADEHKIGSVGKPFCEVQADILSPCAQRTGELILTSPTIADSIFVDGVPSNHKLLPTGQLMTGDLFRIEDGHLYFCGRKSDFIVHRGEKVNLRSVRQLACEHPDVCNARTNIIGAGPSLSYVLTLYLRHGAQANRRSLVEHLGSTLRRSEFPAEFVTKINTKDAPEALKI